jgi:hypothetical protein
VPLSREALRVIDLARPHARNGFLFPNTRGGVISAMTLSRHMERRVLAERWADHVTGGTGQVVKLAGAG